MPQLLTIDQGNSHPHVGIFNGPKITGPYPLSDNLLTRLSTQTFNTIYSSVTNSENQFIKKLKLQSEKWLSIEDLKESHQFLKMPVKYSATLGSDRLVIAYYLYQTLIKLRKYRKILIIDAGTFTTMDVLSTEGFEGGYIYPGLINYFSLYQQGNRLPLPEFENARYKDQIPLSTQEAITQSYLSFNRHTIHYYMKHFKCEYIILTGGQGHFFSTNIIAEIPHDLLPQIIHSSLHFIYNQLTPNNI